MASTIPTAGSLWRRLETVCEPVAPRVRPPESLQFPPSAPHQANVLAGLVASSWAPAVSQVAPQIMQIPTINFNSFLEKEKLKNNRSNLTDWFRNMRIVLIAEQLLYVLDAPLGDPPAETATDEAKNMEEDSSVSEHVLKIPGHAKKLLDLGIMIPNALGIHHVLQSLPPSYKNFVMNYNMQCMDKTLPELFSMLKTAEVEIKKEHQVLMVNKATNFKKKGKPKEKGKFKKGGKKAIIARKRDTESGTAQSTW
ncbi:hypothetical protein QYE76_034615 [Lolium multiflorum]|uniref:Uncharacterized protein n=1 Tax=Lolium multiflorum TaxID=4521 RepID=A0AAD8QYE9_LOLMU|nr:hypothetical protein QYE76_034615 [Lolium multiflorum]